jgi:hypothetical protein
VSDGIGKLTEIEHMLMSLSQSALRAVLLFLFADLIYRGISFVSPSFTLLQPNALHFLLA